MKAHLYRVPDEPTPGALAQLAVDPLWPLLATMLVGGWFGLPWLAFNAWAIGSATRISETVFCAVAYVGAIAIAVGVSALLVGDALDLNTLRYLFLASIGWKLAFAYAAMFRQQASLELFEYYGGTKRNGLPVVIIAAVVMGQFVADASANHPYLRLLLS